jgi:hypothetical protein
MRVCALPIAQVRDGYGRFYSERGAMHPIVHQFRPSRQSAFVRGLGQAFPRREPNSTHVLRDIDRTYTHVAWRTRLFEKPLQRVPLVWDDKRRMDAMAHTGHALTAALVHSSHCPLHSCTLLTAHGSHSARTHR